MSTHGNRVAPRLLLPAGHGVRLAGGDAPGKLRTHHPECTIECTGALQGLYHVLHDLDEVPFLHPTSRRSIRHRTSCNHVLINGRWAAFHRLDIMIDPREKVDRSKCLGEGGRAPRGRGTAPVVAFGAAPRGGDSDRN